MPEQRPVPAHPAPQRVTLRINGVAREAMVGPATTLLDPLRDHLHLTGIKRGCGLGQCGAYPNILAAIRAAAGDAA